MGETEGSDLLKFGWGWIVAETDGRYLKVEFLRISFGLEERSEQIIVRLMRELEKN
jgi:hypothetical protein